MPLSKINKDGTEGVITSGTAVASTSGTSIDFTSIPSWVKRITVMFNAVSTNGTSNPQIQIGAGSVTTSGYSTTAAVTFASSVSTTSASTGFIIFSNQAAASLGGHLFLTLLSSNTWIASGSFGNPSGTPTNSIIAGNIALGGTLDRLRVTTVNGTDTFDAGSVNITYE